MENPTPTARVERAAQALRDATDERIQAVLAARGAGVTWREIAAALGITERATIKLVRAYEARQAQAD